MKIKNIFLSILTIVFNSFVKSQILVEGNFPDGAVDPFVRFFLLTETFDNFDEAKESCEVNGGVPAIIDNLNKFNFVEDLVSGTDVNFYFGLKRNGLTGLFDFVDDINDNDKSFFENLFVLPWRFNQPNDNDEDDDCMAK